MAVNYWTDGGADGDWSNTANWSAGTIPANGEDVFVEQSSRDIDTGLAQSAVALASLNISARFTGTLGTKATALAIGATDVHLGYQQGGTGTGTGSTRLHIDLGTTTAANVVVSGSASSSADAGLNPVRLRANNASTDIFVKGGLVSIADFPDETTTIGDLNLSGGTINLGQSNNETAVTLTNGTITGGTLVMRSLPTTLNVEGGSVTTLGADTMTTVNVRGGTAILSSTGTITTLNAIAGTADFARSLEARTVTTVNIEDGARVKFDPDVMTFTNGIAVNESKIITVSVN